MKMQTFRNPIGKNEKYRVIFLTGPPLKMSLDWPPPNLLGLAPPP